MRSLPRGAAPGPSVRPSAPAGAAGGAADLVVVPVGDLAGDLLEGAGSGGVLHIELGPVVVVVELKREPGWVSGWQLPQSWSTADLLGLGNVLPPAPACPDLPETGSETKPGHLGPAHLDGSEGDAAKVLDGAQQPRLVVFLPVRDLRDNLPGVRAQAGRRQGWQQRMRLDRARRNCHSPAQATRVAAEQDTAAFCIRPERKERTERKGQRKGQRKRKKDETRSDSFS